MTRRSLLPGNASPLERRISEVDSRLSDLPTNVDSVWDPASCPAELLPWLAWALSVDRWDEGWSESQKRQMVARSLAIHRHKGTPRAVREVIDLIFGGGEIVEWWKFDGEPHTFRIVTSGQLSSDEDYRRLTRLISAAKPARAWLSALQVSRSSSRLTRLGTFTHTGKTTRVRQRLEPTPSPAAVALGLGVHTGRVTTVHPSRISIQLATAGRAIGLARHVATITTIRSRR